MSMMSTMMDTLFTSHDEVHGCDLVQWLMTLMMSAAPSVAAAVPGDDPEDSISFK